MLGLVRPNSPCAYDAMAQGAASPIRKPFLFVVLGRGQRCPRPRATLPVGVCNVACGREQRCPWARTTKHSVSCNEEVAWRKGNRGHNNNKSDRKVDTFYRPYSPRHLRSTGVRQTDEHATCSVFFKIDKSDIPSKCGNECSGESLLFDV